MGMRTLIAITDGVWLHKLKEGAEWRGIHRRALGVLES